MSDREELSADAIRRDLAMRRAVSRADLLDVLSIAAKCLHNEADNFARDRTPQSLIASVVLMGHATSITEVRMALANRWTVAPDGETSLGTQAPE